MLRFSLAFGLVLVAAISGPDPALATPFVHMQIDSGMVGEYVSLAYDADNDPHVAYYDAGRGQLKYAVRRGGVWQIEFVDFGEFAGQGCDLAVDSDGDPHISYQIGISADCRYATRTGGGPWTIETVDGAGIVGPTTSIDLDENDVPHVAYGKDGDLHVAARSGGVWTAVGGNVLTTTVEEVELNVSFLGAHFVSLIDDDVPRLNVVRLGGGGYTFPEPVDAIHPTSTIDPSGAIHMAYVELGGIDSLRYASYDGSNWSAPELVFSSSSTIFSASIAVDEDGTPRIAGTAGDKTFYAVRGGFNWTVEFVENVDFQSSYSSLALDNQGNPAIAFHGGALGNLRFLDSSVHVVAPAGGETWFVGSRRTFVWTGVGEVNVLLSTDGGATFETIKSELIANRWTFTVPNAPTRFARMRVLRTFPYSDDVSDSLFTIEADIDLLNLAARWDVPGVVLSWRTDPGPAELAGYRIDRARGGGWVTVESLTREIEFVDPDGRSEDRYRLYGVNGLGMERLLGETVVPARRPLTAWPLPYHGGDMTVRFLTGVVAEGTAVPVDVSLFDLSGRRVRTLAGAASSEGPATVQWDGTDDHGRTVPGGIYFLRAVAGSGAPAVLKVAVLAR